MQCHKNPKRTPRNKQKKKREKPEKCSSASPLHRIRCCDGPSHLAHAKQLYYLIVVNTLFLCWRQTNIFCFFINVQAYFVQVQSHTHTQCHINLLPRAKRQNSLSMTTTWAISNTKRLTNKIRWNDSRRRASQFGWIICPFNERFLALQPNVRRK